MKVSRKTFEGVLHMMPAALSKFFSSVSASVNRLFWKVGFSSYGRLTGKQKLSTLKPLSSSNQATASSSSVTSPAPLSKPEKVRLLPLLQDYWASVTIEVYVLLRSIHFSLVSNQSLLQISAAEYASQIEVFMCGPRFLEP